MTFTIQDPKTNEPLLLANVSLDITERKSAEEALRMSEERYRTILENIEDGYYEVNLAGDITFCNDSFLKIFGYTKDEMMGLNYKHFLDEGYARKAFEIFNKVYTSGIPSGGFEHKIIHKDGSYRYVDISTTLLNDSEGQKTGFRGIMRDITERKQSEAEKEKLESQLRQAYKMEAVGTLAGGIAHDFNNMLGIIVGNAELAMDDVPEWNPAQQNLREIRKACLRARDVVKQILTFSRQTEQTMKPVKIGPIIIESLRLLRSSIPTTIDIQHNISADWDTVNADSTQINQILLNLCTNAAHAMRETGGILRVDLENLTIDQNYTEHSHNLSPGDYLKLTVSDTGQGMDSETLERIFDPYFTTKEVGQGTGMGLSVVHGIVINHKGEIWADSIPGKVTTFNILFPLTKETIAKVDESKASIPKGAERILLIDDEKAIVNTIQTMLSRLGYRVTSKTSSTDALEAFCQEPDKYDLVITDQTMPNMTGKELARELMSVKPEFPIIICTGFSEQIDEERAKEMGVRALIMKPIVISELAGVIRDVLDKKRT